MSPQPFQYQGSKRALAPLILNYLPVKYRRLVDSFAGSAAMTLACTARMQAERYWINDLNKPLADLLNLMINRPEKLQTRMLNFGRARQKMLLSIFNSSGKI